MARLVAVSAPGELIPESAISPRILGRQKKQWQASNSIEPMSLAEMERKLILSVLQQENGNRTRAAEVLGISREGLRAKLQKLRLGDTKNQAYTE